MYLTVHTLGCKVNQYETEYLAAALYKIGYAETPPGRSADLIIVNTCTVTAESDAKSRKIIRRLAKEHPQAEIVVMGCFATRAPDEATALPNVGEVITDKADLPDFLRRRGVVAPPGGLDRFGERHRAYIKVQDGCRSGCAYCIIPSVRPRMSSRPIPEVLDEVRTLVRAGYREIVLTGIHLGFYAGKEPGAPIATPRRLHDLVAAILELPEPGFRIRVSSLEANEVSDELIDLMERHPKRLCRHLHLSLQSGSDSILRAMHRPHPAGAFLRRCETIKNRLPNVALTTDIIVGFPGESESDFRASMETVERIGFSKVHVFRFSPRAGTEAATLPRPVPESVKQARAAELLHLADRLRRAYAAAQIGRTVQVLIEESLPDRPGFRQGTADIYLPVRFPAPENTIGSLRDVVVHKVAGEVLESGNV